MGFGRRAEYGARISHAAVPIVGVTPRACIFRECYTAPRPLFGYGHGPPDFCPYGGTKLSPVEPPTSHYCESCDDYVFYNPIPTARLAVLDDDSILLVKVDVPDRDLWGLLVGWSRLAKTQL